VILKVFSTLIAISIANGALVPREDATDRVLDLLQRGLALRHNGSRVELTSNIRWSRGSLPGKTDSVSIISETPRGEVQFAVRGESARDYAEGWVTFAAWVPARVAIRRIHPGEKLSPDLFAAQEVNIASGMPYEYRGVIFPRDARVDGLEVRQTVLEGQFLTTSAVQRVPDIRRGEPVKIHLKSGDLTLTTHGVAGEPAYISGQVRVMTGKTKRELIGQLRDGGVVEVSL